MNTDQRILALEMKVAELELVLQKKSDQLTALEGTCRFIINQMKADSDEFKKLLDIAKQDIVAEIQKIINSSL